MYLIIYLLIAYTLLIFYSIIILLYRKWFLQLKIFIPKSGFKSVTGLSIIIPARNESKYIGECLMSIFKQNYSSDLFEVIVVDDHSNDDTSAIVALFQKKYNNLKLIKLADEIGSEIQTAYKKKAIERAISHATFNWIITTDADCLVSPQWLQNYANIIQAKQPVFIAAPVIFINNGSVLSTFQYLDFMSLQGITAASVSAGFHTMCNGANMAYRKDIFYEVNGFYGINNIASGDDMLLMNKIKTKYTSKIEFLFSKEAIVKTHPMPTWKSFINQRIRWASKADKFKDKSIFLVLLLVYLLNAIIFIMPFVGILLPQLYMHFFVILLFKTGIELLFLNEVRKFFNQPFMYWFPLFQPIHICYTVIAGWLGKFGTYQWKGRTVK